MKKIFVGNFSFSLSEGELRSMFEPFGAIDSATVVTDRATGRSRGFGFVEMSNNEEADKAIAALNGKDSGGRALTVNEARPKVGGGGGFRGGGGSRGSGGGGRGDRGGNSRDDYQGHARQPREPRW
jgi:RNA recognition motif-containing protein